MTDLGPSRPAAETSRAAFDHDPPPTGWTGWVVFASVMMFLLGGFQAVQGLVAIFDQGYYHVTQSGLVIDVDYTAWGWWHLVLGALIIISAVGVLAGNVAARTVGVLLALLSAIANLVFIEAYPIWSVLIITIDVLVIYALVVHGREMRSTRM